MKNDLEFIGIIIAVISGFYKLTRIEHDIRQLIKTVENNLNVHLEESKGRWQLTDYQVSDIKVKINEVLATLKTNNK